MFPFKWNMGTLASEGDLLCRVQPFDPDVAVADEFVGVVAAAVDLEGDAAFVGVTQFAFFPFHDLDAVDPGGDMGRVAQDAGA